MSKCYFCPHCLDTVVASETENRGYGLIHTTCGSHIVERDANEPFAQHELIDKQVRDVVRSMEDALKGTRPKEEEKVAVTELSAYIRAIVLGEQGEQPPIEVLRAVFAEYKFLAETAQPIYKKELMSRVPTVDLFLKRLETLAKLMEKFEAKKSERVIPNTYPKCKTCNTELEPFDSIHYLCPACRTTIPKGLAT